MKRIICALFCLLFFGISTLTGLAQSGTVTTYAGNGSAGFGGDDGLATSAALGYPAGVAVDAAGNLYIVDNGRVRKVTPDGVIRTVAGNGVYGFSGDGGSATSARLAYPTGIAVDAAGSLFISDSENRRVRKVTPDGVIRTVAGNGAPGSSGDGGPATSAAVSPLGIAVDAAGSLFISDSENRRVRKVTPDGVIHTVAGNGGSGFSGDGGPATSAALFHPFGIAVDTAGSFYIADSANGRVRKVTPDGVIRTVAGNGAYGFVIDGGPATSTPLDYPTDIAVDAAGNLFIIHLIYAGDDDRSIARIRKVIPSGLIATVAGNGNLGGFSGDGGPAIFASFESPYGVAVDTAGNLFIADSGNARIRKIERRQRLDFNGGHDLNGDSKSDILLRDTAGNVSALLLNGYTITNNSFIANVWTGWTIAGTGDFNGDGKTDILWRDADGNVATWLMDGTVIFSYSGSGNLPASWTVAGVADFNGDGKSDILWRNTGGDVAIWQMDGHTIAFSKTIANIWIGWKVAGAGDFNGDGKSDILWRDIAGNVAIWLMDGLAVASYRSITNLQTQFSTASVADFDGDGAADILWRDTTGHAVMWLMNGTSIASKWNFADISTDWTIVGTGDFNGDIRADILWRDAAGNVAIWLMDGPTILSYSSIGNVSDRLAQ